MKKSILWAILAMLLPITQAWANFDVPSTYYAQLSVRVSSGSTGSGKVYAAKGSSATPSYTSVSSDSGTESSTTSGEEKAFCAYAQADDGSRFIGWTTSASGTTATSTANPYSTTVKCSTTANGTNTETIYAIFEKNPAVTVTFVAPEAGQGTYTATDGTSCITDSGSFDTTLEMTLKASAESGYRVYGWYTTSGGTKTYFAYSATAKHSAAGNETIGVDFIAESEVAKVATLDELTAALASDKKVAEIAAGTKILVPSGTTLTIPAGKKVTICSKQVANSDGTTSTSYGYLAVAGTLKIEGAVDGTGKVLKVVKDVTQSAPITPMTAAGEITSFQFSNYGKFKCTYCKTTVTSVTPTVTETPSCTVSWGVTLNGATPYAISAQDPYALNVSFPVDGSAHSTIGVPNQILSINGCQTSSSTSAESGHFLLLKDWKINNQVYQGVVDCAGMKLTFGNSDDYHKRVMCFNGQFDHNSGTFKNGCVACINCSYAQIVSCKNEPMFYFFDMGTAESPATVKITYNSGNNAASGSIKHAYFYSGYINYTFTANNDKDVGKSYVYGGSFDNDPTDKSIIEPGYEIDSSSGRYVLVKAEAKPDVVNIGTTAYKSLQEAVDAAASGARLELIQALELDGQITIASGKQLTIDLAGYDLSGGSIVNEGKLRFEDTNASTAKRTMSTPVTNKGSGTIDITFGDYSGTFTLNGGTLTTHNGTFASTFSVVENGGTWTKRGGKYSCPITIPEGYRVYDNGYFGEIVKGLINPNNPISSTYADFSYTIKALENADSLALYTKYMHGTTARDKYGDADWDRIAELRSCVGYLADTKYIEAAVVFDRPVKKNTFYGVVKMSSSTKSMAFGDLAAGEECRMLIPMILSNNYTPKGYDYMFDGHEDGVWETLYCGGRNVDPSGKVSLDNIGTTVTLKFQLRTQTRSADYTTENQHHDYLPYMDIATYAKKITGKGAIAGETDYTSLSSALSAANYSGTIRLSLDCGETISVSQAATFTLDTNNFAFTGSIAAGTGYEMTASDLGEGKTQYAFTSVDVVLTIPTVEHATLASVSTGDVVVAANNDGTYTVRKGAKVVVTYSADDGYMVVSVTNDSVTAETKLDAPTVTAKEYTITYVLDDGVDNSANWTTYTVENAVSLVAPTRAGYAFVDWYSDATLTKKAVGIAKGSTGERTFYAKWEHLPVELTVVAPEHATVVSVTVNGIELMGVNCVYSVPFGGTAVITYEPAAGYAMTKTKVELANLESAPSFEAPVVTKATYAILWKTYEGNAADGAQFPETYDIESEDIPLPVLTKVGYDFGGWYADENFTKKVGFNALVRGSTGDRSFYACWLARDESATKTVLTETIPAKSETSGGEPESIEVKVQVPDDWAKKVVQGTDEGQQEQKIKEELQKTADNGLKTWENFVLNTKGVTDAGTTITATQTVALASSSEVMVRIETTNTVKKIAIVQVESATNASVKAIVAEENMSAAQGGMAAAEVQVSFASQPAGIYRAAVVVEDVGRPIADVNVPAIEVVKNEKKETTTVLTVPFAQGVGGQNVTLASLIDESSLSDGDSIKRYNPKTKTYDYWDYSASTKTWEARQTFSSSSSEARKPASADELTVTPGQVLIVERTSGEKSLTMVGQYTNSVTTPIERPAATDEGPMWNLVGNLDPAKEYDLNKISGAGSEDTLVVPIAGEEVPREYKRTVVGDQAVWAYSTNAVRSYSKNGREFKIAEKRVVTDDSKLGAGRWFWYVSGKGDKAPKIEWKK